MGSDEARAAFLRGIADGLAAARDDAAAADPVTGRRYRRGLAAGADARLAEQMQTWLTGRRRDLRADRSGR